MENGLFGFPSRSSLYGILTDIDVAIYARNVASNGGTVSTATLTALQNLVVGLKSDGVWNSLTMVAPMCGDQLAAALVAVKFQASVGAIMTGHNLINGDYSESTGIAGNGSTKYIDTGVSVLGMAQNSMSVGTYAVQLGNTGACIGSSYAATGNTDRFYMTDAAVFGGGSTLQCGLGSLFINNTTGPMMSIMTQRDTSGNGFGTWVNFVKTTIQTGNQTWQQAGTVNILRGGNIYTNSRLGFAFVGTGLTDSQAKLLAARVLAFNLSLSRGY